MSPNKEYLRDIDKGGNSWTEYRLLVMRGLEDLAMDIDDNNSVLTKKVDVLVERLGKLELSVKLELKSLESNFSTNAKWAGGIVGMIVSIIVGLVTAIIAANIHH